MAGAFVTMMNLNTVMMLNNSMMASNMSYQGDGHSSHYYEEERHRHEDAELESRFQNHMKKGGEYLANNQIDDAIQQYQWAEQTCGDRVPAKFFLAVCLEKKKILRGPMIYFGKYKDELMMLNMRSGLQVILLLARQG
jgi:hypothetical protein